MRAFGANWECLKASRLYLENEANIAIAGACPVDQLEVMCLWIVFERAIGLLQQVWHKVGFVGVVESRHGELELLR